MFLSQTKVYFQALYSLFPGLYCISGKDVSNWDKESRGQDRRCYLCRTLGSRTWSHKELNCVLVVLQRALTVSVLYDLEVSPTYRKYDDQLWLSWPQTKILFEIELKFSKRVAPIKEISRYMKMHMSWQRRFLDR